MANGALRKFLQEELRKRKSVNPSYSIRAFARYLNVSDSYLSAVLRGQKTMSEDMLTRVGMRMGVDPKILEDLRASLVKRRELY